MTKTLTIVNKRTTSIIPYDEAIVKMIKRSMGPLNDHWPIKILMSLNQHHHHQNELNDNPTFSGVLFENDITQEHPTTSIATDNKEPTKTYSELRKKILQIHSRTDLSPTDKNQQVQILMSSPKFDVLSYTTDQINAISSSSEVETCVHYQRNCSIYCNVCEKFYPCHLCHDEKVSHSFNRFNTVSALLKCSVCSTIQSVHPNCSSCGSTFGSYFCEKCLVIENDATKKIFHCDDCGICRIGDRSLFFHCSACKCCLSIALKNEDGSSKGHKCIERSLESNCPICGEYLFTTRTGVIFMACGHAIHYLCHEEHIKRSYQCPICLKSLADMSGFFSQLDELLANQPMPSDMAHRQSNISCNDCMKKSVVDYHLSQYHKCPHCNSYNTYALGLVHNE